MKLSYYPSTDSLYIELSSRPGADTVVVGNVVIDVDEDGKPVDIDIGSEASKIVDLREVSFVRDPADLDASRCVSRAARGGLSL